MTIKSCTQHLSIPTAIIIIINCRIWLPFLAETDVNDVVAILNEDGSTDSIIIWGVHTVIYIEVNA